VFDVILSFYVLQVLSEVTLLYSQIDISCKSTFTQIIHIINKRKLRQLAGHKLLFFSLK
jgi:hypothetical protein